MQFQETKQREMEMMEKNRRRKKGQRLEGKEYRGLSLLWKSLRNCFRASQTVDKHIHHHHHHIYHHYLHHHLYNCFAPVTPEMSSNRVHEENVLTSEHRSIPGINIEASNDNNELMQVIGTSPHLLRPSALQEMANTETRTGICPHSVSIHAEAASSLSTNLDPSSPKPFVTEAKTSVSLMVLPPPNRSRSSSASSICSSGSLFTSSESAIKMTYPQCYQECELKNHESEGVTRKSSLREQHQTHSFSSSHVYEQNCCSSGRMSRQNSEQLEKNQHLDGFMNGNTTSNLLTTPDLCFSSHVISRQNSNRYEKNQFLSDNLRGNIASNSPETQELSFSSGLVSQQNSKPYEKKQQSYDSTSDQTTSKTQNTSNLYYVNDSKLPNICNNSAQQKSNLQNQTHCNSAKSTQMPEKKTQEMKLDVSALKEALFLVKKEKMQPDKTALPQDEKQLPFIDSDPSKTTNEVNISHERTRQDSEGYSDSVFDLHQSDFYNIAEEIDLCQKLRNCCRRVTESKIFINFIMVIIFTNMACMSLEHYQQVSAIFLRQ